MENKIYNQLLLDVQKRFGSSIQKVSQLKILQERIAYTTKKHIAFNTLRRLFGFLEYTNPNINTLNILSQYLGHDTYDGYQNSNIKDKEWRIWQRIINIETADSIEFGDILWLESQITTMDYHLKLLSIIKSLIYRKKYGLLDRIFNSQIFDFDDVNRLRIASNVCLVIRSLDSKAVNEIIKVLAPNIVFRENILHWFIDYSHLNGYYGMFLRKISPLLNQQSHEALFGDLMLNYTNYLSGNSNLKKIPLERIKDDFFIVLKGRTYAYNLIYYAEEKNSAEYEKTWLLFLKLIKKEDKINLLTIEIFPALLLLKDSEKINYLLNNYYENILNLTDWSGHHIQATVLMALATRSLNEKKIKEANINFSFIDQSKITFSYFDYTSLFYLLVKYKLAVANNAVSSELKIIETDYVAIVNKTGFKRFSLQFLKNF